MTLSFHPPRPSGLGGNFCDHNPNAPRLVPAYPAKQGKGGIPRVLTLCAELFCDYYYRPTILPSLNMANGSERQQRTERRRSCVCLVATILKFTDLASLRVGIPTENGFANVTIGLLAKHSGLGKKCTERALADLKAAGLVSVVQHNRKKSDGSITGLAATKKVSAHLFRLMGLGGMLSDEQRKARKRLARKKAQWEISKPANENGRQNGQEHTRLGLFLAQKMPQFSLSKKKQQPSQSQDDVHHKKKVTSLAIRIQEEQPSWTIRKCFEEAEKALS